MYVGDKGWEWEEPWMRESSNGRLMGYWEMMRWGGLGGFKDTKSRISGFREVAGGPMQSSGKRGGGVR